MGPHIARAGLIDLDISVFFQLAVFLILLVILNKLAFQPLLALFEERRKRTEGARAEADAATTRATRSRASPIASASLRRHAPRSTGFTRAHIEKCRRQVIVQDILERPAHGLGQAPVLLCVVEPGRRGHGQFRVAQQERLKLLRQFLEADFSSEKSFQQFA